MALQVVHEKNGVFYFFSVRPEAFALGLYSVIMSIMGANLLWIYVLVLCASLHHSNLAYTVDRLITVQVIFSSVTTMLWWMIYQEKGRSVVTHITFYTWFGSKIMASVLEVFYFPQFYDVVMRYSVPPELDLIVLNMTCGSVLIIILECLGLFFAHLHLRSQRSRGRGTRINRAFPDNTLNI